MTHTVIGEAFTGLKYIFNLILTRKGTNVLIQAFVCTEIKLKWVKIN